MGIPLFDETPEFEKSVAIASHEAAWMKRELESLVGSGKAASKALASRVEMQRGLLGLVGKKPDGDPPVETFLDEAIASIGDDGELSASLVAAMSVNQVTPVLDVLKALGPMRVKLGNKVFNATTKPLESFLETELATVVAERDRYIKAKATCATARADYLGLKKTADAESRAKVGKGLLESKVALRQSRAKLAEAVAAMEAKRQYLLLESVHEAALAYQEFITTASAALQGLPDAIAALRSRTVALQVQAQADLSQSRSVLDKYLAEQDKVDDSAPQDAAVGQNLGRSHDADIRRALEAGTGNAIKQGYLMKQARTWGWRRRFFVLDSNGMLTYYNEKAAVKDTEKRLASKGGAAGTAPAPAGAVPSSPTVSDTGGPHSAAGGAAGAAPLTPSSSSASVATMGDAASVADSVSSEQKSGGGFGFGGRALNFMKKAADKLEKLGEAAPVGPGGGAQQKPGQAGDDDEEVKFQTVNLRLSAVKLDGDSADRSARDLRYCFRIISPSVTMTLQAESEAEREAWVQTLQGVIAELITMGPKRTLAANANAVMTTVHQGAPGNATCADCGEAEPDWASLNIGVVLCQSCAGCHRSLGTHVSKVRSIALDADSWAPPIVGLFTAFGNALANGAWEGNRREGGSAAAPPLVPPGTGPDERLALIRNKYADRAFVAAALAEEAASPDALREAVAAADVPRVMSLIAGGAKPPLLHVAAGLGDVGGSVVVAALLLNGADTAAVDAAGLTATDVARAAGAAEDGPLMTVLLRSAAKRI